jgi:hypothetical protein
LELMGSEARLVGSPFSIASPNPGLCSPDLSCPPHPPPAAAKAGLRLHNLKRSSSWSSSRTRIQSSVETSTRKQPGTPSAGI